MIAAAGYPLYAAGRFADSMLNADPQLSLAATPNKNVRDVSEPAQQQTTPAQR